MTIQDYVTHYLRQKLHDKRTLLVYDGERHYHDIVKALQGPTVHLFDATESAVRSREDAQDCYATVLPFQPAQRMIVYVPRPKPVRSVDQVRDPFWPFQFGGCLFPDGPQDDYDELCLACFPDKAAQLEQLFQQEKFPPFDTINTLGGGQTYARLQTLTGGQSEREIILAVLLPPDPAALDRDRHFLKEWRQFAKAVLGYKKADTDRDKDLTSLQQSLWQYLLISEFVYDLPAETQANLPSALRTVSRGSDAQKPLILSLCETLRDGQRYRELYQEQANRVSETLELPDLFRNETNLGHIVTFDFEDRHYIGQVVQVLLARKPEEASQLLRPDKRSLWARADSNRQQHWQLVELIHELLQIPELPATARTLKAITTEYTQRSYRLDQLHRQMETGWAELTDPDPVLSELVDFARTFFREQTDARQRQYQAAVVAEGYPQPAGLPSAATLFDKQVAPLLQAGKRVAYVLVDALRYELARELEDTYLRMGQVVSVEPYLTVLPSYTKLGMAALLPDADRSLRLIHQNDEMVVTLNDQPLKDRAAREQYLRHRFGDQMLMLDVGQFLNRPEVAETVKLLVLTATDLDKAGENLGDEGLAIVKPLLQKLTKLVQPLRQAKFDQMVLVTDHGFVWQAFASGDKAVEPAGTWPLRKHRVLLGEGADSPDLLSFSPSQLHIRTDQPRIVFTRQFATFQRSVTYFHEGLSMQENVVGMLSVPIRQKQREKRYTWQLTYRGQTTGTITMRRPSVDMAVFADEQQLFAEPVTVRLDVLDAQGEEVGALAADDSAGLLTLQPGDAPRRVPLAMQEDYEGAFTVRLTDPVSGAERAAITLQTDYAA